MYLKSIDVQGFKSFANKIHFDFSSGMTGIVGPNGSGKSNVADAVRWVFGEQSAKQLRSGNMQDVIFAGTQARKAQSFAAVSITLDNTDHSLNIDYPEVTVTRKIYRSGESEYILNDNQCRLKDIQELFFDTGIGKEGYSIIGQTQIDKILSGKPDDRRELFDEAVGIVKFKKRKAVTLRRLEDERANMVRVTDILSELEKQVGPLKRQSENAKQYLQYRDELKVYDLNAFILDQAAMNEQLETIEKNLQTAIDDLSERSREDEKLKHDYEELDLQIRTSDDTIEQVRLKVQEASENSSSLEGRINVIREQIRTEEVSAEHINARLKAVDQDIEERKNAQKEAEDSRLRGSEELKETISKLQDKQQEIEEAELRISLYRKNIEESHGKVVDLLKEQSEITAKLQHYETLLEQTGLREQDSRETISEAEDRMNELVNNLALLQESLENAEKELTKAQAELEEIQADYDEAMEERNDVQRRYNDLSSSFQIIRSKIETLKNLQERYEGYNNAVRRIMEVQSRFRGIEGVVADLIKVDEKYQTAIETVLGAGLQNIVTKDEASAKEMVQFLKDNRAGRATFLPLDTIKASSSGIRQEVLNEKGIIDSADHLVQADSRYDRVIQYLLNRFVVAEDIDSALRVARKYNHTLRIVTLSGEFLNVGGSITGGSFRNSSNLLSRGTELKNLEEQAQKTQADLNTANRRLSQLRQMIDSSSVELEDAEEKVQQLTLGLERIRMESDSRSREKQMLTLEIAEEKSRLQDTLKEAEKYRNEQKIVQNYAADLENRNLESEDSTGKVQEQLQEAEEVYNQKKFELDQLILNQAAIQQNDIFLQETIVRLKTEMDKLSEEKAELLKTDTSSSDVVDTYKANIAALTLEKEEADTKKKALDENLAVLVKEREKVSSEQKSFFTRREELTEAIASLTREQVRLEGQKDRLEEKLDSQTEYLWTEYSLTPSEALMFRDESMTSLTAVKRHVNELKSSISGLGHVNVNAIEQYKEVAERYEFLKSQYDDLTEAEKTLVSIIDELDEGMRRQFSEKFKDIQTEFDKVFKDLFGGGQGTLTLNANQDVIDSDIAIIAQPPGKKLQNMMQLSNGEKALTAIALIFAIQNLKPSPFCLLDEIEAALDESNVGRFTGYLKKLTGNTQFIVITHRRGTMTASDRLYGITMQEKGVSTLVSVNLVEADLDA